MTRNFAAGISYKKSGSKITCSIFRGNENTMHDRLEIILSNRQTKDFWTVICLKCKAAHCMNLLGGLVVVGITRHAYNALHLIKRSLPQLP